MAMAVSARADFDAARNYRLAPKSAALGGMSSGLEPSLEAGLLDPSMLPLNYQSGLAGYAGTLGNSLLQGGSASISPWSDTALGISWANFHDARQPGGPTENEASLSLATRGGPGTLLGIRGKWMQLGGGPLGESVQAAALDAGLHWGWQGIYGHPLGIILGLNGVNLADTLPKDWSRGLSREIGASAILNLGQSFSWGLETAWISQPAAASTTQLWRTGAEWMALEFLSLRGGYNTDQSYSAGLGLRWKSAGLTLDYAWLASPIQGDGHRLGLSWRNQGFFKPDAELRVRDMQLEEGEENFVSHASFSVDIKKELIVTARSWKLILKTPDGRVVKEFEGSGAPPSLFEWDGKDSAGTKVKDGQKVNLQFIAQLADRKVSAGPTQALERALAMDLSQSFMQELNSDKLPLPMLEPKFSNDGSGAISQVAIQMHGVSGTDVKAWELKIQDTNGEVVRTMKGLGPMPIGLVWDGKDDQGQATRATLGLRVKLSYKDSSGQSFNSLQPLLTEESLRLASLNANARPRFELEGLSRDIFASSYEPQWSQKFMEGVIDDEWR